jgi:hypothetical protein
MNFVCNGIVDNLMEQKKLYKVLFIS